MAFAVGAAVALLVGGYTLFGQKGRKRRDALQDWIDDVEEKILDKVEGLKDLTKEKYEMIVDEIISSYEDAKDFTTSQAKRLSARFKSRYREIREMARESARVARRKTEKLEKEE